MPVGDQPVGAIDIGHHLFQQVGALDQTRRKFRPFGIMQHDGHRRIGPVAPGDAGVAIFAEKHARIGQMPVAPGEITGDLGGGQAGQMVDQTGPCRAHLPLFIDQFIGHAGQRAIVSKQAGIGR